MTSKVLVVDDDKMFRLIIRKCLGTERDVVETESGAEALEALDREQFDLVILDWNMPGMSGIDVLRRMRLSDRSTPVVMVTAISRAPNVVEAIQAGATDYLPKPFRPDEFRSKINALLRTVEEPTRDEDRLAGGLEVAQRCVAPLAAALVEAFDEQLKLRLQRGEMEIMINRHPAHQISGLIQVSHSLEGVVVIGISRELAFYLARCATGNEARLIDESVTGAVGDLLRAICRRVKDDDPDLDVAFGEPEILIGRTSVIEFPAEAAAMQLPFQGPAGGVTMQFGLVEHSAQAP